MEWNIYKYVSNFIKVFNYIFRGDVLIGIGDRDIKTISFSKIKKTFNHLILPVVLTIERSCNSYQENLYLKYIIEVHNIIV